MVEAGHVAPAQKGEKAPESLAKGGAGGHKKTHFSIGTGMMRLLSQATAVAESSHAAQQTRWAVALK